MKTLFSVGIGCVSFMYAFTDFSNKCLIVSIIGTAIAWSVAYGIGKYRKTAYLDLK